MCGGGTANATGGNATIALRPFLSLTEEAIAAGPLVTEKQGLVASDTPPTVADPS
jgi:hypothetical protein